MPAKKVIFQQKLSRRDVTLHSTMFKLFYSVDSNYVKLQESVGQIGEI